MPKARIARAARAARHYLRVNELSRSRAKMQNSEPSCNGHWSSRRPVRPATRVAGSPARPETFDRQCHQIIGPGTPEQRPGPGPGLGDARNRDQGARGPGPRAKAGDPCHRLRRVPKYVGPLGGSARQPASAAGVVQLAGTWVGGGLRPATGVRPYTHP